jgi:hypothetical protein
VPDIGDVHDMVYLETRNQQRSFEEIFKQKSPQIPDMCIIIYSRPTGVEAYLLIV